MISLNDLVTVAGLIFAAMIVVKVISQRLYHLPPVPSVPGSIRVLVMVPIIYAVAIALAIRPKSKCRFADIDERGERPVAAYVASGVAAAGAGMIISILTRVLFDVHAGMPAGTVTLGACPSPQNFLERFSTAA